MRRCKVEVGEDPGEDVGEDAGDNAEEEETEDMFGIAGASSEER